MRIINLQKAITATW